MQDEPKPRARLSVVEVIPPDMPQQSRGISVRYGILTLEMPSGEKHSFPVISGGFGRGAIPGIDKPLQSAANERFPVAPVAANEVLAADDLKPLDAEQARALKHALQRSGWALPFADLQPDPLLDAALPAPPAPVHPGYAVRAKYEIFGGGRGTGKGGFQSGGADFIVRFVSPRDVDRGLNRAQMEAGMLGAFALHPDGDNGDLPEYVNVGRKHRDGIPDDGNNGCLSLSSKDAKKFQDLYFGIPSDQRPDAIYFLEPDPAERVPDMRPFSQSFSGLAR